ncbi:MAG: hypothetical protein H7Y07_01540 [Pyrinomonadaceae bacterium]|nr:hypothetical protein [Sphingobacteriaceae bacterium]
MKKQVLVGILAISIIFVSCKKKSKEDTEAQPEIFKLEYSKLGTEQQKQEVEKAGVDFISKINVLPEQKFISGLQQLNRLEPQVSNLSLYDRITTMSVHSKENNFKGLFASVASFTPQTKSLSGYYGVYTWNHTKKDWDESPSSNRLEIRYPSDSTKIVNNSILTISYLASKTKLGNEELPAFFSSVLKIDNNEEFRITSNYEYKPDGTPSKVDMNVMLGVFTFKHLLLNDGSTASSEWTFLKGTESLLGLKVGATGTTSFDAATVKDQDIIKNANASFQIMNIKLLGEIDIKGLSAEGGSDPAKTLEALNKYAKFAAVNTKDNTVMARIDFILDPQTGTPTSRLIFKDDSKMSFDEFFKSGFDNLFGEIAKLN